MLLEEVENKTQNFDHTAIDSNLAQHKETLESCRSILGCANCAESVELSMLLTLVLNKLLQFCKKVVQHFSQQSIRVLQDNRNQQQQQEQQQQTRGGFADSGDKLMASSSPSSCSTSSLSPTPLSAGIGGPRHRVAFLGDYEINSPREWISLMRGLTMVQLKDLKNLAAQLKRDRPGLLSSQLAKLGSVDQDVRRLVADLSDCEL